ncbi:hypothetical protein LJC25_01885 [Bacteroidales bacterium OttesenSCG-928-K03]|nr:hypothetical protein [Bacteroidales bacterium OttesenSCG-928-L14]MDL2240186.1 hypothetical protein [Bacteroidales bacterium OttesenSCG-928-K22]MDL2242459.1 hypothetical protein [Bacteroidales bacterium OttesenSCG-928-K03]
MTNIYWPVYKNIEQETIKLSYNIHFDDNQLNVFSTKIMDLILRAAAEIESISKELYKLNGGSKTGEIKYDEDAIKYLKNIWKIDKKEVIISNSNCFQTTRVILPFVKNETRTGKTTLTYSWNNAYQNLKHDRANSLNFGSVKYLFDILAALFILNIYYKNETFSLNTDSQGTIFPINLGSDLFSVILSKENGGLINGSYHKNTDFDKAIYFIKMTNEDTLNVDKCHEEFQQQFKEQLLMEPKITTYLSDNNKIIDDLTHYDIVSILGTDDHFKALQRCSKLFELRNILNNSQYEAVLNKNQI